MRKLFKKSIGAILLGAMILSTSTVALASGDAPVTQREAITRAMRLDYGSAVVRYDNSVKLFRDRWYDGSTNIMADSAKYFTINPGVPVELGFNLDEEQYVRVTFTDSDNRETVELFVGATKDFKIRHTFTKRVSGSFAIENWSNGDLTLNNLYVAY